MDLQREAREEFAAGVQRHRAEMGVAYVVQVWNGRRWAKVRGIEGGPWRRRQYAERCATSRARMPRRSSSTEGMPHRVIEVAS